MSETLENQGIGWFFEPEQGEGTSSALTADILGNNSNLTINRLFAREAIQNSLDAARPRKDSKIDITLKRLETDSAEYEKFVTALQLTEKFTSPLKYANNIDFDPGEQYANLLNGPIDLLVYEDFNTTGLEAVTAADGTFVNKEQRLVRRIGYRLRNDDIGGNSQGGSNGVGGLVFVNASSCATAFFYTRHETTKQGIYAQLIGKLHTGAFMDAKDDFTGIAWFGAPPSRDPDRWYSKNDLDQQMAATVTNEEAIELAKALGFTERSEDDFGTSVMILQPQIGLEELRDAVEDYWWPKLLDEPFVIRILDKTNQVKLREVSIAPETRSRLLPFITVYKDLDQQPDPILKNPQSVPSLGIDLGQLSLKRMPEEAEEEMPISTPAFGRVALVRNSMKMVLNYIALTRPQIVGVFRSKDDPDLAELLRVMEGPAHTSWERREREFRRHFKLVKGEDPERYKRLEEIRDAIVGENGQDRLLARIKRLATDFFKKLEGNSERSSQSGAANQIAARAWQVQGTRARPAPQRTPQNLSVTKRKLRINHPSPGTIRYERTQTYSINDKAPPDQREFKVTIQPQFYRPMDDKSSSSGADYLDWDVHEVGRHVWQKSAIKMNVHGDVKNKSFSFSLSRGAEYELTIKSAEIEDGNKIGYRENQICDPVAAE